MDHWQKRERQVETTTKISTTLKRRKSKSGSIASMPRSLDYWASGRGREQAQGDESIISTDSLSTLGLQQMQGYEHLDNLQQEPLQWADDDDKVKSKAQSSIPTSTITFPVSKEPKQVVHSPTRASRRDGNRFSSLPARQKAQPASHSQYQRSRYNTIAPRPDAEGEATPEWETSAGSSPECNTTPLGPMSLRQRSIKSLQGIASAWVPGAVRSPYESESEVAVVQPSKGKGIEEKRPIRLDRRRLQKAVSLAVEAAQASEQDEKAWKQKKKRLARQQQHLLEQGEGSGASGKGRLVTLPWKRRQERRLDPSQGTMVTVPRRTSEVSSSDDDNSSQVTKRPGSLEDEDSDDEEDLDEEAPIDDDFSVDLYISSLGYLLAALGPRDAENVGDKHREELKRKLEEALKNLETGDAKMEDSPDREEVIQWRVEKELVLLEQAYHQRRDASPSVSRAHQAAQASSQRVQRQSVAGYLTSSAIDLGLSVGAGALAAAARGVASLLPILTADAEANEKIVPLDGSIDVKSNEVSVYSTETADAPAIAEEDSRAILTRSQWNLTRTLAQSVASTMYSNLAAVAEQRRQGPLMSREVALYDSASSSSMEGDQDGSDQLMIIAATLARNVKRSPLPSQIRALTSQVVSLIAVLDERYSLSKRSTDVALRKTGQALYYVRKNDLHVKALRAVWAIVEASVAAVEAYRDEEEWKGEVTLPSSIEAMHVKQ